jgi:RNA polymerase sigma-70 factor (ECF subfamily)
VQLAQLTAEMAWLQRLARALLRNDEAADLAQDTWLTAKDHLPKDGRPLRPWLSRVARNLAISKGRARRRREAREQASAALAEGESRPDELVQRVELQKAVATEVVALAEPYRSTVLLHFFEGLSSADIARRLGIPDGTVRRRLKTAIDELRARLKTPDGERRHGWLAALAPLANAAEPAVPTSTLMGGVMVKKIIALVVVLLLLLAGVLLWKAHGHDERASHRSSTPVVHLQLRPVGNRHEVGRVPEWAPQSGAPARRIAGHVVSDGKPVAAATVRLGLQVDRDLVQPLAEVTATPDGVFDFGDQPAAQFTVSANAQGYAGASVDVANADPRTASDELLVVLEDCRWRMEGTVSDASGGGIAKVHLSVDGLGGAYSDATGRYSMCLSPRMGTFDTPQQIVRLEADGYGTTTDRVMLASVSHQDFVLVPEAVLVGHVVTADNHPVSGARVLVEPDAIEGPHHVTTNWAETDADGHFRVAGLAPGKFRLSATTRTAATSATVLTIARATNTSRSYGWWYRPSRAS